MIISKSIKYFEDKANIDKRIHRQTAYKIQFYNNNLIDDLVEKYNNDELNTRPKTSMLMAELSVLNKPEVYKGYNRIINSKFTSNDNLANMLIANKANKDLNKIVEAEVERINKNLDYVEQVLRKYNIPTIEYQKLVEKQRNSSLAHRQDILKEVAVKSNELLVSEGWNIPQNYSYLNLETYSQSLLRQSQMTSTFEEKKSINENYVNDGKNPVYTHKQWIHTHGGETTRHMSNHMQKVLFDEPFIVVNDKTLDIDEMMYPCDPAGSPSNSYICYCEVDFI